MLRNLLKNAVLTGATLTLFAIAPATALEKSKKRTKPGPSAPAADIREESPLRGIAKPFDFNKTLQTFDLADKEVLPENEIAERQRITEEARHLYYQGPDKIEALFESYRTDKSRTSSGIWKLTNAYAFLENLQRDWTNTANTDWNGKKLKEWRVKYPDSPVPYLFQSAIDLHQTTAILNDRLARSTYPGGDAALRAKLAEAKANLETNKEIASKDPHYYALLIRIMRNQGAELSMILDVAMEGADRHPEYYSIYFEAVLAIAHGSKRPFEDIEALANTAVEKTRATLGEEVYVRIYWYALQMVVGIDGAQNLKWNWEKIKNSMETVLSRYPAQWNIQNFAMYSCFFGDAPQTRTMMEKVKGVPLPEVWSQTELHDMCRDFASSEDAPGGGKETRKAGMKAR